MGGDGGDDSSDGSSGDVSEGDDYYDSDPDGLHELVREIDTAFGLLPHGGAYKESNFYDDYGNVMG